MKTTYFGLSVYKHNNWDYVYEEDIRKLPFYDFWKESAAGSTSPIIDNKIAVNIVDWENFCRLFIKTGRHRYQRN